MAAGRLPHWLKNSNPFFRFASPSRNKGFHSLRRRNPAFHDGDFFCPLASPQVTADSVIYLNRPIHSGDPAGCCPSAPWPIVSVRSDRGARIFRGESTNIPPWAAPVVNKELNFILFQKYLFKYLFIYNFAKIIFIMLQLYKI